MLTSLNGQDLGEIGYAFTPAQLVERRIRQVIDAGADGVVASPLEAAVARRIGGPDFLVVTPASGQPGPALTTSSAPRPRPSRWPRAPATIVVGRPITAATDPRAAALAVVEEMAGA